MNSSLSINLFSGDKGILNASKNEINKEIFKTNILAWKEEELSFTSEALTSVLEDVSIFYGVQFKLDNAVVDCPITTAVKRDNNIHEFITIVSKAFPGVKITSATKNLYYVQGTCK